MSSRFHTGLALLAATTILGAAHATALPALPASSVAEQAVQNRAHGVLGVLAHLVAGTALGEHLLAGSRILSLGLAEPDEDERGG